MIKLKDIIAPSVGGEIDSVLKEWRSMSRTSGCVSSTNWFVNKVSGFHPVRITRYTKTGEVFEHVVAESDDKKIRIDLAPQCDQPK